MLSKFSATEVHVEIKTESLKILLSFFKIKTLKNRIAEQGTVLLKQQERSNPCHLPM